MVVTGGKRTVRGSCDKLEVIQFLLFEFLAKADIKILFFGFVYNVTVKIHGQRHLD